ncbi:hypothetical protein SKAU_G00335200 [Synaphobranchus kaupii]|uniref:Uncharacterized protein n=1 Tax=Synaphobranchus kaupii TaxID=118154 RepID=A0A9Q1ELZ6_SYNKA|nr:hypothetical protein SKAU_G00335200 [Synaphobranchus kaupii]
MPADSPRGLGRRLTRPGPGGSRFRRLRTGNARRVNGQSHGRRDAARRSVRTPKMRSSVIKHRLRNQRGAAITNRANRAPANTDTSRQSGAGQTKRCLPPTLGDKGGMRGGEQRAAQETGGPISAAAVTRATAAHSSVTRVERAHASPIQTAL